jgi:hypothetical protein
MSNQVYVGVVFDGFSLVFQAFSDFGGLKVAKTFQDAPRCAQDGPKTPQEAAKRRQDAPKTPQDAPRAAQDGQNDAKMEQIWHQNRIKNRCSLPKAIFSKMPIKPMKNQ